MMARRINKEGIAHLKRWEGLVLYAYDDFDGRRPPRKIMPGDPVRGTLTIGYGSTGEHVRPGLDITEPTAEALLLRDLERFERAVERLVKVPLTDNQFAALVSFCYNIGEGAFRKSTLLKKLNAGDYEAVPGELAKWVNSKGVRLQGLANRRAAEAGLWAKGSFVSSNSVPAKPEAPPVLTKENVSWGAGIVSTLGATFASPGPLQWALAIIILAAFGVGLYLFITKRLHPA